MTFDLYPMAWESWEDMYIYKKDWRHNKENRRTQSKRRDQKIHLTHLPVEVLYKNQNNNSGFCDTEKNWKKEAILMKLDLVG